MDNILLYAGTVFMGFFAIMNPIANIPIFFALTSEDDDTTTKTIALRSLLLAFFIITAFSIAGKIIFDIFGLTLPSFQISGGLIVFFIGFHMLQGNHSSVQHPSSEDKKRSVETELSVAVTPLGMPILAGPGTIVTAMNFSSGGNLLHVAVTILMFAVLCIITYLFFIFGEKSIRYVGSSALNVITRMMGLILSVVGTQMIIEGIHGAFKI